MSMLKYAEAKSAFDSTEDEAVLKHWDKSDMMRLVERNTWDIQKERLAKRRNS